MDISKKLEALRLAREETPAVAAVPSTPARKIEAAAESIQQAKASEFPVAPSAQKKKTKK